MYTQYLLCTRWNIALAAVGHLNGQDEPDALKAADHRPQQDKAIAGVNQNDAATRRIPRRPVLRQLSHHLKTKNNEACPTTHIRLGRARLGRARGVSGKPERRHVSVLKIL